MRSWGSCVMYVVWGGCYEPVCLHSVERTGMTTATFRYYELMLGCFFSSGVDVVYTMLFMRVRLARLAVYSFPLGFLCVVCGVG